MKKYLLILMAAFVSLPFVASAAEVGSQGNVTEETLNAQIEVIKSIEGYVFLGLGDVDRRDLSQTFSRTKEVMGENGQTELRGMEWRVYPLSDQTIAQLDNEGGIIGNKFGETIITANEKLTADEIAAITPETFKACKYLYYDENDPLDAYGNKKFNDVESLDFIKNHKGYEYYESHYFLVFVCPTVTVVSPEGAIYQHQKIYNQRMRVDFSHSEQYFVNCVIMEYEGNKYDITNMIAADPTDDMINVNGHYMSTNRIRGDVSFTISMQDNKNYNNPTNLDKSPFRIQVCGKRVVVVDDDPKDGISPVDQTIEWKTLNSDTVDGSAVLVATDDYIQVVGDDTKREAAELGQDLDPGIYFLNIKGDYNDITYKVVIR